MDADVKGALAQINSCWRSFEHRGKPMSKNQVEAVLKFANGRGYKSTSQLKDEEVDNIIKQIKQ